MTTPSEHYAQSFQADVTTDYQFLEPILWRCVTTGALDVESDFRNFLGALDDDMDEVATRLGDTVWSEVDHLRRRLTLATKDKAIPLDTNDLKRMNYDPTSGYAKTLRGYFARWLDKKVLTRLLGTAYGGKAGATSINIHDAGESRVMQGDGTLATAGSAGSDTTATTLTAKKIQTLGALFDDNGVPDDGQRYLAIDSWQARNLTMSSTWTYEQLAALNQAENGKMVNLAGINLVILPQSYYSMSTVETDCFETIAWHRSAVLAVSGSGDWAPEVKIAERPDKKHAWQIFMKLHADASRMLGKGVVKVLLKKITALE
jgi:hypothetical protein